MTTVDEGPFNIEQAAKRLGIGKSTLKKMVAARTVPCTRPGGGKIVRFTQAHIDAILAAGEQPAINPGKPGRAA